MQSKVKVEYILQVSSVKQQTLPLPCLPAPMRQVVCAAHLCTAVFEGDVPLLRRLVRAGMSPDSGDYDGRRAAHIAAAESSLAAVSGAVCGDQATGL